MSLLRGLVRVIDWLLYGAPPATDETHRERLDFLRWERETPIDPRPYDWKRQGL